MSANNKVAIQEEAERISFQFTFAHRSYYCFRSRARHVCASPPYRRAPVAKKGFARQRISITASCGLVQGRRAKVLPSLHLARAPLHCDTGNVDFVTVGQIEVSPMSTTHRAPGPCLPAPTGTHGGCTRASLWHNTARHITTHALSWRLLLALSFPFGCLFAVHQFSREGERVAPPLRHFAAKFAAGNIPI